MSTATRYSLATLATEKRLNEAWLRKELGLKDGNNGEIEIPYWDAAGEPLYVRRRMPPGSNPRFRQPAGTLLRPYGLWRLDAARQAGMVYLCEGESDTWTLWTAKFAALGLPGSNSACCLRLEDLDGIGRVYIAFDADEAGRAGVAAVVRRLAAIGYTGEIYQIDLGGLHDL